METRARMPLTARFKSKWLQKNAVPRFLTAFLKYALLIGIAFVILFPFYVKISSALMSVPDLSDKTVKYIPRHPTLGNIKFVLTNSNYFTALRNTALISVLAAVIQTFISSMVGYGFARFEFKGKKLMFGMVIFTLMMPPQTILVPLYINFRYFDPYGLLSLFGMQQLPNFIGSPWPVYILSILGLGLKNGLFIFIMSQFYKGMPKELAEAAYVDGYGVLRTYASIMLPLSRSMLTTVFLLSFSWQWTDTFYSSLFYSSMDVLPKVLNSVVELGGVGAYQGTLLSSVYINVAALLIVAPLTLIYLFTQRLLAQGIERSGIVG